MPVSNLPRLWSALRTEPFFGFFQTGENELQFMCLIKKSWRGFFFAMRRGIKTAIPAVKLSAKKNACIILEPIYSWTVSFSSPPAAVSRIEYDRVNGTSHGSTKIPSA